MLGAPIDLTLVLGAVALAALAMSLCAVAALLVLGASHRALRRREALGVQEMIRSARRAGAACVVAGGLLLASLGLLVGAAVFGGSSRGVLFAGASLLLVVAASTIVLPLARRSLLRVADSLEQADRIERKTPPEQGESVARSAA